MRAVVLSVVLCWAFSAGAQAGLRVRASAECPRERELRAALASLPHARALQREPFVLHLDSGPDGLRIELERSGHRRLGLRTVRSAGENCEALTETVALLVDAWLTDVAAPTPTIPREPVQPEPVEGLSTPLALNGSATTAVRPEPVEGPSTPLGLNGSATPAVRPEPVEGPSTPLGLNGSATPPRWAVFALGGGSTSSDGSVLAMGSVRLDRALSTDFGAGAQADLETARDQRQAPGRVSAWRQSGFLYGRWVPWRGPGELHVLLGLGVDHFSARASGFTVNGSASLFAVTGAAGAEWHQPLGQRFDGVLWLRGTARPGAEDLDVTGAGTVLILPAWSVSAGAGVGWRFL